MQEVMRGEWKDDEARQGVSFSATRIWNEVEVTFSPTEVVGHRAGAVRRGEEEEDKGRGGVGWEEFGWRGDGRDWIVTSC